MFREWLQHKICVETIPGSQARTHGRHPAGAAVRDLLVPDLGQQPGHLTSPAIGSSATAVPVWQYEPGAHDIPVVERARFREDRHQVPHHLMFLDLSHTPGQWQRGPTTVPLVFVGLATTIATSTRSRLLDRWSLRLTHTRCLKKCSCINKNQNKPIKQKLVG